MNVEMIDADSSDKLEALSLERNQSKGSIALEICEFFFGTGVPHLAHDSKRMKRATAA